MRFQNDMISVIIPVYNGERFIRETILSVEEQGYDFLEIVIVDDCSTDNSEKIITELQQQFNNIIYKRLDVNSGAAVARNIALETAKGQYVAFLDSDDIWLKNKLSEQMQLITRENAVLCYTAINMIDEQGNLLKDKRKVPEKCTYSRLLRNTLIATSTVIVNREIAGDFRMSLRRSGQDYATWLMLLRQHGPAVGINEAYVNYRRCSGSLSSNKVKNYKKVYSIQVEEQGIHPIVASCNCLFYIMNAVLKYFF